MHLNKLDLNDKEYESLGVKLADNNKDVIKDSDIIIQLGLPSDENLSSQRVVGFLKKV